MSADVVRRKVRVATTDEAGGRLDRFLARRLPDLSRARLQALIRGGRVLRDGAAIADQGHRVRVGECYELSLPAVEPAALEAQTLPLAVCYEDEHLIVIDKPKGQVVHPSRGHASGTLVNALIAHCGASLSGIGGVGRPGIVHRLDKDTTGLLVVAKTDRAHAGLARQFATHGADGRLLRHYLGLAWGEVAHHQGTIDAPLGRSSTNRTKIAVVGAAAGRRAVTHYRVLARFPGQHRIAVSLLKLRLETGRTHQIRVHLAHIGHPLLGDMTYGAGFKASARGLTGEAQAALRALARQALHAAELAFVHPVTGKRLTFNSPLPADMDRLIAALERR
jgi:23S rRNA pseudouridine1911/1915/1917 synthase